MTAKKICLIGANGNMGKRYQAVMRYLEIPFDGFDLENMGYFNPDLAYHSFIVATPTDTHIEILENLKAYDLPILCEKPITKNLGDLKRLLNSGIKLRMINQYEYILRWSAYGPTYYDYFKSGADGLAWDCINIIGLSESLPSLHNISPIWKCAINGQELSISQMDAAYIRMIDDWYKNPQPDHDYILEAHEKVKAMT